MIDSRGTLKALALALAGFYATSAAAQDPGQSPGQETAPGLFPPPPPEAAPEGDPAAIARDAQVLLNRLGTLTADEDAGEAARLAAEIQERWTHSGSPTLDLLLRRGSDAMAEGDLVRAVSHLTALTDTAPDFAEGWNRRATAFFMMDRYGEAMSDIEQVLILEPRHFGALAGLGILLEGVGEPRAALGAFRAAAQVYPAEPNVNDAIERLEAQTGERTL